MQSQSENSKKFYHKPQLLTYGDINSLTKTVNNAGTVIDAMFGTIKTA